MNKRKRIHVMLMAAIAALTFIAGAASRADAGSFDGPFVQVGAGFSSLGTKNTFSDSTGSFGQATSQLNMMGTIAAGYSYELPHSFNLAADVFYNFGSHNAGYAFDSGDTFQNKLKNIWGITLEPGYKFSDKALGFVKLGWAMASTSLTLSDGTKVNAGNANGFLYGLGFKHLVTDHISVGMEAYQIAFSSKGTAIDPTLIGSNDPTANLSNKPNLTYGGITVGYQF